MQNPITENQRAAIRKIVNKMGYPAFTAWLSSNEPDINPDYMTCSQAQRILNRLSANPIPKAGKIDISTRFVGLQLYRNKDGAVIAFHLCKRLSEHQAFDDPKHCPAWKRIDVEVWRPRHMKAYERICAACGKYMPADSVLEAVYHNAELDGLDKLGILDA